MKRRPDPDVPSPKRLKRLVDQLEARNRIPARVADAQRRADLPTFNPVGLKKSTVTMRRTVRGHSKTVTVLTPYFTKLLRKRRAARKAAHESRRRNRANR
jgi:hypothetical protein